MKATYVGFSSDTMKHQIKTKIKTKLPFLGGFYEVDDYASITSEMAEKLTVGQVIDVEISEDGVRLLQPWEIK